MNAPRDLQDPFSLDQKLTLEEGPIYLNGTQALVRVMLDQRRLDQRNGLNTAGFVCGYPGSPRHRGQAPLPGAVPQGHPLRPAGPPARGGQGRRSGAALLPMHGELLADAIAKALLKRLPFLREAPAVQARAALLQAARRPPITLGTARTPCFCSGCPYNTSLKLPDGAIVGAGIGCHFMALWMGPGHGEVKGYTQTGGEGAQWV